MRNSTVQYTANSGRWFFSATFVRLLVSALANLLSPFPPAHTLPSYPWPQLPQCPISQAMTIGGGLPPSIIGTLQHWICLTSCSLIPSPCTAETSHLSFPPTHHPYMQPPSTTQSHPLITSLIQRMHVLSCVFTGWCEHFWAGRLSLRWWACEPCVTAPRRARWQHILWLLGSIQSLTTFICPLRFITTHICWLAAYATFICHFITVYVVFNQLQHVYVL